jgi:hypothetical protein
VDAGESSLRDAGRLVDAAVHGDSAIRVAGDEDLSVFVELKYADDQFLPNLEWVADKHGISRRVLETVRAKLRRLGILDHVSRFNKR